MKIGFTSIPILAHKRTKFTAYLNKNCAKTIATATKKAESDFKTHRGRQAGRQSN